MADPTQLDRIEAALAAMATHLNRLDLQQQQQTGLLIAITNGVQLMSQTADSTKAAVDALDTKVDTLIAAIQPAIATLREQLATAQQQAVALQAQLTAAQSDAAADAAELAGTIASAQAEGVKVQTAIDALTPPSTPPAP